MNTPWTESVDRNLPLPEYPRPQLARRDWLNLNGLWDYAINTSTRFPKEFDGQICVPYSPEAPLSGVNRALKSNEYLWYRRCIAVPEAFEGKRLLLHFGAVDQTATVWVNSAAPITHVGGYLPFDMDVTDAVEGGALTITVRVSDATEKGGHTRGKQKTKRGGIWYTPQSGIWQTVWLEAVPQCYIETLSITPDFDGAAVEISAGVHGEDTAYAEFGGFSYPLPARIPVPDFEAWSPENPKLYGILVRCGEDVVQSYFAMRKFSVEKGSGDKPRLFLNGREYFHNGLLDQGYWPDGLYTPPTDEAMVYDISMAKAMGFNTLRKHIKVEPLRWYYHCDRLGMLVWQDMPNGGGSYNAAVISAPLVTGVHMKDSSYALFARSDAEARAEFKAELGEMIRHLYNCPCIAMWVIFNEGWGQFDAAKMLSFVQSMDKTRCIDHASGWHDQGVGKVKSDHVYFKRYTYKPDKKGRAVLLSEFGGYSHGVIGHCFSNKDFGYKKFATAAQLELALEELYQKEIAPAKAQGLSAAILTQLTDVEDELNGLITYDRKAAKIAPEKIREIIYLE